MIPHKVDRHGKARSFKPRLLSDKKKCYLDIEIQQNGITFQVRVVRVVRVDTQDTQPYHSAENLSALAS